MIYWLEYFTVHWPDIVCIISTTLQPTDNAYGYMEDIQLERAATDIINILTPIKKAIDDFQHEDYYLGECFEIWMNKGIKSLPSLNMPLQSVPTWDF